MMCLIKPVHSLGLIAAFAFPLVRAAAQPVYTLTDLGTLGGTTSYGYGLNANGDAAGLSYLADGSTYHAFRYSGVAMLDLGTLGGTGYGTNPLGFTEAWLVQIPEPATYAALLAFAMLVAAIVLRRMQLRPRRQGVAQTSIPDPRCTLSSAASCSVV